MNELEKVKYTKEFVDKLADGINPLTDEAIPDGDLLNNGRITRCMFYVSDILRQVIEQGGTKEIKKKMPPKAEFFLDHEQREKVEVSDLPVAVSIIAGRMNEVTADLHMKKITHKEINGWLVDAGFLEERRDENNKIKRYPTQAGLDLGISTEIRKSPNIGSYSVVVYNRQAQEFIIDNLDAILEHIE